MYKSLLHRIDGQSVKSISLVITKIVLILISLYFFICSLSFLSDSFRLLGGRNIGGKVDNELKSKFAKCYIFKVLLKKI